MLLKTVIVCAATTFYFDNKLVIVASPRHHDPICNAQLRLLKSAEVTRDYGREIQGFVDQFGKFYTREAAYDIAEANGQIVRECGNPGQRVLYSEHLY